MTIAEIRKIEEARQDTAQLNVVHFIKEGNGFFRAHDWSAWLLKTFPPNGEIAGMSVTAKRQKDGYVDAFVGFPATSIRKYIPDADAAGFQQVDADHFTVTVELTPDIGEVSFDNLSAQKEEWKATLKVSDKKSQREEREAAQQAPRLMRLTDVIGHIAALPLEDISPREAYDILKDLRRKVLAIF